MHTIDRFACIRSGLTKARWQKPSPPSTNQRVLQVVTSVLLRLACMPHSRTYCYQNRPLSSHTNSICISFIMFDAGCVF